MNDLITIMYGIFMLIVVGLLFFLPSIIYIVITHNFYKYKIKSIMVRRLLLFIIVTVAGYYYYATEKFNFQVYGWLFPSIITSIIAGSYFFYSESKVLSDSLYTSKKALLQFCLTGMIIATVIIFISINFFPFSFGERDLDSSNDIWKTQQRFQSKEDVLVFIEENLIKQKNEELLTHFTWNDYEKDLVEIEFMGNKGYEFLRDEGYIRIHMIFLENGKVMKHIRISKSV